MKRRVTVKGNRNKQIHINFEFLLHIGRGSLTAARMLSSSSGRRVNTSQSDSAYEASQAISMKSITNSSYESIYANKSSHGVSTGNASVASGDKEGTFSLSAIKNWFSGYSRASSSTGSLNELRGVDSRLPLLSDAAPNRCAASGASKCCCSSPSSDCPVNENLHSGNLGSSVTNCPKNSSSYALTTQAREGLAKLGGRISSLWEHPKRD